MTTRLTDAELEQLERFNRLRHSPGFVEGMYPGDWQIAYERLLGVLGPALLAEVRALRAERTANVLGIPESWREHGDHERDGEKR